MHLSKIKKGVLIISSLIAFFALASSSHAAINFDFGQGRYYPTQAGVGGINATTTTSEPNELILMGWGFNNTGASVVSGITCDSLPGFQIYDYGTAGGTQSGLWGYIAPVAGVHGCTITYSGTHNLFYNVVSYTGVDTTNSSTILDGLATGGGTVATSYSIHATSTVEGDVFVAEALSDSCSLQVDSSTTRIAQEDINQNQSGFVDNWVPGPVVHPAGYSHTLTLNGCSSDFTMAGALLKPSGGGGGGNVGVSGSFGFPKTGANIPDFANWVVNLGASLPYQNLFAIVRYQQIGVNQRVYDDSISVNLGAATTTKITIPKFNPLLQLNGNSDATSSWFSELFVGTSTDEVSQVDSSTFTITPLATTSVSLQDASLAGPFIWNGVQSVPTWLPQSQVSSTQQLFAQCPPPGGWTDIGGGISYAFCAAINQLFIPGQVGMGLISDSINSLEGVPPYSWFFQVNNQVQSASAGAASSTGLILNDIPAGFGHTANLTLLAASPSSDPNLTKITKYSPYSLLDIIWNAVLALVIILIVIGFYKIVL